MRLRILLLVLFACLQGRVHAQDPHFTQAHRLPAWYNPAATGALTESLRVAALYRNQWASVTSPFRTEAFFAEKRVGQHGLGFNLVNNHAGPTGFRQLYAGGQWSLTKQAGKNLLSAGIHMGILQRSFDPSNMTFDEQYSADQGSSAAMPHTENFAATNKLRPDAGLGFLWRYAGEGSERFTPFAGAGATHLNKPRETYIAEEGTIEPRYTVQAGTGYRISETVSLASMVQYSRQSVSKELMASVRGQMKLNETSDLEGLLLFRNADALALGVSYRWSQYSIGMSYDVNISGITRTPGAAEIMLVYTPEVRTKPKRQKKTVEVKTEQETNPVAVIPTEDHPPVVEPSHIQPEIVQTPVISELAEAAKTPVHPVSDSTQQSTDTPLSEAIADILSSIEKRNDSIRISPAFNESNTPDLEAILAAFTNGSNVGTESADQIPVAVQQDIQTVEPMAALPIARLNIGSTIAPVPLQRTGNTVQTNLPLADKDPDPSSPVQDKTHTNALVVTQSTPLTSNTPDQIEFEQWIGFEKGSRKVHGLYKLDVIEPALDLLLNDPSLNLELSMPVSEGQTIRKGIVKDIFVTKGLEPARIRILPEQQSSSPSSAGQAGAVRVRILRRQ